MYLYPLRPEGKGGCRARDEKGGRKGGGEEGGEVSEKYWKTGGDEIKRFIKQTSNLVLLVESSRNRPSGWKSRCRLGKIRRRVPFLFLPFLFFSFFIYIYILLLFFSFSCVSYSREKLEISNYYFNAVSIIFVFASVFPFFWKKNGFSASAKLYLHGEEEEEEACDSWRCFEEKLFREEFENL